MRVLQHLDCGQPAVRQRDPSITFAWGIPVMSADWQHLDGTPIELHARQVCDSCGQDIRPENWQTELLRDVADANA